MKMQDFFESLDWHNLLKTKAELFVPELQGEDDTSYFDSELLSGHMHTHVHAHTCTHRYVHMHTCTHMHTHVHADEHKHTCVYIHMYSNTYSIFIIHHTRDYEEEYHIPYCTVVYCTISYHILYDCFGMSFILQF